MAGQRKTKKRNFTEVEVETLVGEVEARKEILFGGHGIGITNIKKNNEWQHVAAAVNAVSGTERTVPELKNKWSDIKVHFYFLTHSTFIINCSNVTGRIVKIVNYRWVQSRGCPHTARA